MGGQCIGGLSSHAKDRFIKLNLSLVHCPSTVQGIHRLFPGAFSDFWTLWIPASSLWSAWMMLLRDPCPPRLNVRQANLCDLRPLCRAPYAAEPHTSAPAPVRIGLVNARPLVNKGGVIYLLEPGLYVRH